MLLIYVWNDLTIKVIKEKNMIQLLDFIINSLFLRDKTLRYIYKVKRNLFWGFIEL